MAKMTLKKTHNFTVLPNSTLRDKNLSLKAIGLLCKMLSLPDDWEYSILGLCSICKEGETAIRAALDELKKGRYLIVKKLNSAESGVGTFAYEYYVYEEPAPEDEENNEEQVDSSARFPGGGNPHLEDHPLNKIQKDKETKEDRASPGSPAKSRGGHLFSTTPQRTRKSSIQKTNAFITMCEKNAGKKGFSVRIQRVLSEYFRMLGGAGALLPEQSIQEQLNILWKVPEANQEKVIRETISHGWKSLQYVAKEYMDTGKPSWDNTEVGAFKAKTAEEKRVNPLEGVPEEDIF